jgi:hypothetical protein
MCGFFGMSVLLAYNKVISNSALPHTCYMPHPSHSSPFDNPTNAAHNNDFFANLRDVASCWCVGLTRALSEYCRNSSSNAAAILSYRTCIAASSLTVTGVYITVTDRETVLQEQQQ